MRILSWLAAGFGAACAVCVYWGEFPALAWGCLILGGVLAVFGRDWTILKRTALALLGCALGIFWFGLYGNLYLDTAKAMDNQTQTAEIRVSDYSRETDYGICFDGQIRLEGKAYPVWVYADAQEMLRPGDTLTGEFQFRYTVPDGSEEWTVNPGKGIFLQAFQRGEVTREQREETWQDLPAKLRRQIKEMLRQQFPADVFPFVQALLLGDTGDLSYQVDTDLKVSGIRHVVAVSGLHVAILFALVGRLTLHRRFLTALVGLPVLLLFAALAGFTPSVCRACLMCGLMQLGAVLDREYDGPTALSFAVMVMLVANPMAVTSVSLQLSAASVAGIFLFSPGIRNWLRGILPGTEGKKWFQRIREGICASIAVSLSAMVLTTPLCAWYFGMVSLVGPLTNLLTLWVIGFVFYGILAVCLLGIAVPALAGLLAEVVAVPVRFVLGVASVLAEVPLAAVYPRNLFVAAWLVFVYALLLLFLVTKRKRPALLGCCAVFGLCLSLTAGWAEAAQDSVRFTMLDVGQGQCILLQSQGRSFLVDCGGDSETIPADLVAAELLSQGIDHLDGMILTHLDRDHAGAAENLLHRMDCDLLLLPPVPAEFDVEKAGHMVSVSEDLEMAWGSTKIRIFPAKFSGNGNENSLCILFDTEKCDILITGDRDGFGERVLLRYADLPKVDILVAGHHGSKHSTCQELLDAVDPDIVCISAGKDNSYGHPAPELLKRLYEHGCTVYRTDQSGTIVIRR